MIRQNKEGENTQAADIHISTPELENLRREASQGNKEAGKKISAVVDATVEDLKRRTGQTR